MGLVTVVRTTGSPVSVPDASSPGAAGYGVIAVSGFTGTVPPSGSQQLTSVNVRALVAGVRAQFEIYLPCAVQQTIAGDVFFTAEVQLDGAPLDDEPVKLRYAQFPSGQVDPLNATQISLSAFGSIVLLDTDVHVLTLKGTTNSNTTATVGFSGVPAQFWLLGNVSEVSQS